MFTGLVETTGQLRSISRQGKTAKLAVETTLPQAEIAIGDSVAVNGACLTVEEKPGGGLLVFHALQETLSRTNLGQCRAGAEVNLERALRLGDRLGGHLVSGHIDGTAKVVGIKTGQDDIRLTIALPPLLSPLLIPKGSVAVNGVSLTIADLGDTAFTVCLIPHTWKATNLHRLKPGSLVNLEADMLGKYILRWQQVGSRTAVDMDTLRQAGFLS